MKVEGTVAASVPDEIRDLLALLATQTEAVIAAGPLGGGSLAGMRTAAATANAELFAAADGFLNEGLESEDLSLEVTGGAVALRVFTPPGAGPFPAFLHIHGGGWLMGSIDWPLFRSMAEDIAAEVPCVVVDVEYRLAPEHPFPIGLEDCYAALLWLVANEKQLNVDRSRVAVGGDSAGAAMAAAVCLMARDRGGPSIRLQALELPALDHAHFEEYPSAAEFGTGWGLDVEGLIQGRQLYFADPADAASPYASPILAKELHGLPPAVLMTAEFDPLRDSGEAYGARLAEAGVAAKVIRRRGHIHGSSFFLYPRWEQARAWRRELLSLIREGLR